MPLSKTSPKKVSKQEKQASALELRKAGYSMQKIADYLQCSKTYAHKLVSESLQELAKQSERAVEELRALENDRLDALWEQAYGRAMTGDMFAINTCIKISDRKAKLNGLDGTQKFEHSGVEISLRLADCSKKEDE